MDENGIGRRYIVDLMRRCREQLVLKEGSSCFGGRIPDSVKETNELRSRELL